MTDDDTDCTGLMSLYVHPSLRSLMLSIFERALETRNETIPDANRIGISWAPLAMMILTLRRAVHPFATPVTEDVRLACAFQFDDVLSIDW